MKNTKKNNKWYMVEYDFLPDGRPNTIREFKNKAEAEAYAKEVNGIVTEWTQIY